MSLTGRNRALFLIIAALICAPMSFAQDAPSVSLPDVLGLEAAQHIALEGNPSLMASHERILQAKARIDQAKADYYPTLSASVGASFTQISDQAKRDAREAVTTPQLARVGSLFEVPNPSLFSTGSGLFIIAADIDDARSSIDDTRESYQANLTASYLIFDGLGRRFRKAAAKFGADSSEAAYRESERLLLSAVAFAYHNVQLARENIAIAEADEAFNRRQLTESEARRRVGTGSLSDVLNFEVRVRSAQTSLIQANRVYAVALIALSELMGLPEAQAPESIELAALLEETPEEMETPSLEAHLAYAQTHRPDLQQTALEIERRGAIVKVGKSTYYPSVGIRATKDGTRERNVFFEGDDFSSSIGISVNYDIYQGGRRKAQLLEARAAQHEAEFLYENGSIQVASDVRQAVQTLSTSQQELVLQRETTQYVERNLELVEKEYREGQGSLVRLNEAQRDLISQRSRLALAQVALRQSWEDLRAASGESLQPFTE